MQSKRIHLITVVKWLAIVLLLITWGLGIAGFATGQSDYYRWAVYAFGVLLCVAFLPLVVFVISSLFEKK
jgi:predicted membrane channel-forming protein YqfA (hemolysin III family)